MSRRKRIPYKIRRMLTLLPPRQSATFRAHGTTVCRIRSHGQECNLQYDTNRTSITKITLALAPYSSILNQPHPPPYPCPPAGAVCPDNHAVVERRGRMVGTWVRIPAKARRGICEQDTLKSTALGSQNKQNISCGTYP
jgi:hypothetical protein